MNRTQELSMKCQYTSQPKHIKEESLLTTPLMPVPRVPFSFFWTHNISFEKSYREKSSIMRRCTAYTNCSLLFLLLATIAMRTAVAFGPAPVRKGPSSSSHLQAQWSPNVESFSVFMHPHSTLWYDNHNPTARRVVYQDNE